MEIEKNLNHEMEINNKTDSFDIDSNIDTNQGINKKQIGFLALYFFLVFLIEFFYREPLFNKTLFIMNDFKHDKATVNTSKFFSYLGTMFFYIIFFNLFYIITPLNISGSVLVSIFSSTALTNFLKLVYQNSRPFWIKSYSIESLSCNTGYGNPSGHALSSTCFFLTIMHLTIKNFKVEKCRLLMFIFTLVIIFLICISRIYLDVHSINQIIFGSMIGFGLFILLFFNLKIDEISEDDINRNFSSISNLSKSFIVCNIIFFLATIIIYSLNNNTKAKEIIGSNLTVEYNSFEHVKKLCPVPDYKITYNDSLYQSLSASGVLGIYLGAYLFNKNSEKKYFSILKIESYKQFFIISLLIVASIVISFIPFFILKVADSSSVFLNVIFSNCFPFFVISIAYYCYIPLLFVYIKSQV